MKLALKSVSKQPHQGFLFDRKGPVENRPVQEVGLWLPSRVME